MHVACQTAAGLRVQRASGFCARELRAKKIFWREKTTRTAAHQHGEATSHSRAASVRLVLVFKGETHLLTGLVRAHYSSERREGDG
jgi:hypothetical protein